MEQAIDNIHVVRRHFKLLYTDYWVLWAVLAVLYVPAVFYGQRLMKNRPAFVLKYPFFVWNALLAIFSGIGFFIVVQVAYQELTTHKTVVDQICDYTVYNRDPRMLVLVYFSFSKILEWVDTVFLVLKKKPVIVLHWYHHIATMLYCWHSTYHSITADSSGLWFACMNLFVHTIMYGYYALAVFKGRIWWGKYLTKLQIAQMVVGVWVAYITTTKCEATWKNNYWGTVSAWVMYVSYFFLFLHLALTREGKKPAKPLGSPAVTKEE